MIYQNFEQIIEQAKGKKNKYRLAVACAGEQHVLQAVLKAAKEEIIVPYLIGDIKKIKLILEQMNETVPNEWLLSSPDDNHSAYLAVELVRENRADFIMKGLIETSQILKAIFNKETGIKTGKAITHMTLTHIPAYHKLLVITDAGINIEPNIIMKKDIIQNAVDAMRVLGYIQPKVAILTSVEKVNSKMAESVDASILKEMYLHNEITDCILEGPIAVDLALNREAAKIKGYESPVSGDADILVMPNLVSANILSKALREFADTTSVGIALGAKVPIVVSSRGASVRSKYTSIVVISEMLSQ